MDLSSNNWITGVTPLAIFTASLLGSGHCAAMCGGLVVTIAPSSRNRWFYHLGRGLGYMALGALGAKFGKVILSSSWLNWASNIGAALISLGLIFMGVRQFFKSTLHMSAIPLLSQIHSWSWGRVLNWKFKSLSMAAVGLLSALLPCGWLYTFVLGAAAMGATGASPAKGAMVLGFFWLGTLPALSIGPALVRKLLSPLGELSPRLSGVVLMALGFLTIFLRMEGPRQIHNTNSSQCILHRADHDTSLSESR